MRRYVKFVIAHRFAVITAICLTTIFLGYECKNLKMAIKLKDQLPQSHPYVQIQNDIQDLFGGESGEVIGIIAKDKTPGSIYNPKIIQKACRITDGILDMQSVISSSVLSICNSPNVRAIIGGETIEVRELVEEPFLTDENDNPKDPETLSKEWEAQSDSLKKLIESDPRLRENLINKDGTAAIISFSVEPNEPDKEIQKQLDLLSKNEEDDLVNITIAGGPTIRMEINRYTKLAGPLMLVAIILIGFIHYHAFRTWQAAVLPLITAIISMVWAMGILGLTGKMMDSWSAVTPIIILAVAAGHAVQILKRYYEELAKNPSNEEAVVNALCAVGPVMIRVGIVASFGFGSLIFVGVESVRVFGMLLSAGILSALAIEMTLIPAVRSKIVPSKRERERESREEWVDKTIAFVSRWATSRPKQCVVYTTIATVVFGIGIPFIQVNNNIYNWLPQSSQVRQDYDALNNELGGVTAFKLLIESDEEGAIKDHAVLSALNDLENFLRKQDGLNRIYGFADVLRRMNKEIANNDSTPDSNPLIEQYLILYPMDALSGFVDFDFKKTIVQGFTKDDSAGFAEKVFETIRYYTKNRFAGLPVRVRVAGGPLGVNTAMDQVVTEEKESNIIQVSLVILVLATFFLRSFVGGLYVMIPMVLALAINMGMIGWLGIWFDMTVAAITAMGVSVGADFAIYLLYRVREEIAKHPMQSIAESVMLALLTSGKAIFFVASAVIGGFMILYVSPFLVWKHLGVLTALIILVHAFSAITILPALIVLFKPKFVFPKK